MFQLRRRKQESYWYLCDSFERKNGDGDCRPSDPVGQFFLEKQLRQARNGPLLSTCHDPLAGENETPVSINGKTKPKMSLEYAMAFQTKYTSWPSSIWEMNFDDADEEIVFEYDDGAEDDYFNEVSCKKSVGTLDTEDETMPSPCSSPEFQNTWELEDLDLSAILHEDDCSVEEEVPVVSNPLSYFDRGDDCDLLACSADLRKNFLNADGRPLFHCSPNTSGDSNYILIEESFGGAASYSIDFQKESDDDRRLPIEQDQNLPNSFLIEESFETCCSHRQQSVYYSPPIEKKPRKKQRLRFADEEGKAMETVHLVDCRDDHDDLAQRRVLILMLLPKQKKYEFVHAEYSLEGHLSVSTLLKQLPRLASDPVVRRQKYCGLCRTADGGELINALAIQTYDLALDEILVAVLKGNTGKAMLEMAKTLVENEQLLKAVKRTNRLEHTLHRLESKQGTNRVDRHDCGTSDVDVCEQKGENAEDRDVDNYSGKVLGINVSLEITQDRNPSELRRPSYSHGLRDHGRTKHLFFRDKIRPLRDKKHQTVERQASNQRVGSDIPRENKAAKDIPGPLGTRYDGGLTTNPIDSESRKAQGTGNHKKKSGFFGKRVFQRKASPTIDSQPSFPSKEATSNLATKKNWTTRFAKKRWDRFKAIGTRKKDAANIK